MGKKKKPFIDKKTAQSFQVVHRSQRDPLQADEDSSKHVLLPLNTEAQGSSKDEAGGSSKEERKQELHTFGIDFEDGYDYMQHMKTRTDCTLEPLPSNVTVIEAKKPSSKEFGNLKLPSEAFSSAYEENEGLLNLAAPAPGPHPEWDPDIVAALDGDFDPEDPNNEMDDDFMLKANAPVSQDMESDDDLIRSDDDDDDDNAERYFPSDEGEDFEAHSEGSGFTFGDEETKSRFTNYSMTSSVIRRNEGLTLLDDRFEKVMEEYDEDEIGALDHEEMAGNLNPDNELLNTLVDDYVKKIPKVRFADLDSDDKAIRHEAESSDEGSGKEVIKIDVTPKEQWDCESILSTYSNLYNHPTLITEPSKVKQIKLSNKTGIPIGVLPTRTTTKHNTDQDEEMDIEKSVTISGPRPRHEDKEAKMNRKKAVKEERRVRRVEKKTNKLSFKAEQKRQEQSLLNAKAQKGQKL